MTANAGRDSPPLTLRDDHQPDSTMTVSTLEGTTSNPPSTKGEKTANGTPTDEDMDEKLEAKKLSKAGERKEFEERGMVEVGKEGATRKAMLLIEEKSGREVLKDVDNGPYTIPRWRHSLPFMKPKYPPPPPPVSLDDTAISPQLTASWFSLLYFNWISPMMALGSARPLEPTDMWKLGESRSSGKLAARLSESYENRKKAAEEYNRRLADPRTPLPRSKRILFAMLPNREKREHDYRTNKGKKKATLVMALNDTFGWYFWFAGVVKIIADACSACSPLVVRALIKFSSEYEIAMRSNGAFPYPNVGRGIGMAIGLFLMLLASSMGLHHYFLRSMTVGLFTRSAIITSVYDRALRFTQKSRRDIPNGKLTNHISTDTSRIDFASGFVHLLWTAPVQFVVIMIILLVQIGYSALPGIFFLLVTTPAQGLIMKNLFTIRKKSMIWTDKRAKLLQEILGGMRIVKMMSWENKFLDRIAGVRGMEVKYIRQLLWIRSAMMAFAQSMPVLATILALVTYSATAHTLEAATIFTVVSLFQLMRMPLMMFPMSLSSTADAVNALKRLEDVFDAEVSNSEHTIDYDLDTGVLVEHASFEWDSPPASDPKADALEAKLAAAQAKANKKAEKKEGKKNGTKSTTATPPAAPIATADGASDGPKVDTEVFSIKDISLSIPRGSLTAVVGRIGSGKSSLLQGLMGEMRRTEGKVIFSGTTSLCAQTPWIQNATVRENILFGLPFDEDRYWSVVRNACLEPDLELLEDGDGTEIGEKGITLSGGQKQRVNIARAMYFDADIVALDDPLSALDAGVGKQLFFNGIVGALGGKTRILVTHALHFLPHVDNIIMMEDGRVSEIGTFTELKNKGGAFAHLIRDFGFEEQEEVKAGEEEEAIESDLSEPKIQQVDRSKMVTRGIRHQLMQEEERGKGKIKSDTWMGYFKAGKGPVIVPLLILAIAITQGFTVLTSYWLVWWQQYEWGWSNNKFMGVYVALGIGSAIATFFQGFSNSFLNYFASVTLHRHAITRVMFAPQSFFDTTPLGRIMNRFSKDVDTVDNTLADAMRMAISTLGGILGAIILLAIISPWFLIAVAVILFCYYHCANFYRLSSREFKRIDSVLRSSLYSHFAESLAGISTIRAYGESDRFARENVVRMDTENRAYYMTIVNQRWLGIRLDILGSILTFSMALIVVLNHKISAAKSGLGLSTMLTVQQAFSWLVRQIAEVENDMVGAERILYYANELEQEAPQEIKDHKPAPSWPDQGRISFNNVRMKYRPELPEVLKGLSLDVNPSEKIGIVGRTGAGKSSIMIGLFRMVELCGGNITIDDVDISKIGLHDLRSRISIIPQEPLLFSGTLRSNIDPFNTRTDAELYDALKRAHLIPSVAYGDVADGIATPTTRFTLDYPIEEEGANLSVGERSLVSLARALVRDAKVLVLDEATASVDVETDAKIQETIRREFGHKTLLCIAHRLRTILSYDRILVMAEGQVEEFDTPENLFLSGGHFREMCEKSSITLEDIRYYASMKFEGRP